MALTEDAVYLVNRHGAVHSLTPEHAEVMLTSEPARYRHATSAEIGKWWAAQGLGSDDARRKASEDEYGQSRSKKVEKAHIIEPIASALPTSAVLEPTYPPAAGQPKPPDEEITLTIEERKEVPLQKPAIGVATKEPSDAEVKSARKASAKNTRKAKGK